MRQCEVHLYFVQTQDHTRWGVQEIKDVLRKQINVSLIPTGVSHYLMHLTQEEMKDMCGESESSCVQVQSPLHIMVGCGRCMYKLVHDINECGSLIDLRKTLSQAILNILLCQKDTCYINSYFSIVEMLTCIIKSK